MPKQFYCEHCKKLVSKLSFISINVCIMTESPRRGLLPMCLVRSVARPLSLTIIMVAVLRKNGTRLKVNFLRISLII